MSTLITFIGKGEAAAQPGADPYQRTRYLFTEGNAEISTFFGEALANHLKPKHLIFVGTATSSWRALALDLGADLDLAASLERTEKDGIDTAQCTSLEVVLGRALQASATCVVIDEKNHLTTIAQLYRLLPTKGPVYLDLTHGYRFMPMLALAAVQMHDGFHPGRLAQTQLWYGRLDEQAARSAQKERSGPPTSAGEGQRLLALERALALASGVAAFVRSLDPEPLLTALGTVPVPLRAALEHLSDALLTHTFTDLGTAPQQIISHLGRWDGDPDGILADEIRLVLEPMAIGSLGQRLVALARWASERGHHALAAIAAYEGLTRLATRDAEVANDDEAKLVIRSFLAGKSSEVATVCDRLRRVRNRVAHGSETTKKDSLPVAQSVREALPVLVRLANA
jgi:CRISPR-associated Csx2 family protein